MVSNLGKTGAILAIFSGILNFVLCVPMLFLGERVLDSGVLDSGFIKHTEFTYYLSIISGLISSLITSIVTPIFMATGKFRIISGITSIGIHAPLSIAAGVLILSNKNQSKHEEIT